MRVGSAYVDLRGSWATVLSWVSGQLLYHRKTSNRPHLTRPETTTVCRMTDEKRVFGDLRAHVTGAFDFR
jgi:hypothetical protein